MDSIAQDRLQSLIQRFESESLHHGILFRGHDLLFLEKSIGHLYRKILNMKEDVNEHPDLFHLRPSGKARIITVEKTRSLMDGLYRTGHQSNKKVAIIHEADRMRKEAANAFLKTLEEPPAGTFLFLLSTRPYSILPTIRSRTIVVRLEENSSNTRNENTFAWLDQYTDWVALLLDRQKVKQDRTRPVFMAYGLIAGLIGLIRTEADRSTKDAISKVTEFLDDKERDAFEAGVRRGVRRGLFREISEHTRNFITENPKVSGKVDKNAQKLQKVIKKLEKATGLLEVNLKEDSAIEDFFLSSLRIWSAK